MGEEFVDAVRGLWDSFEDEAYVRDAQTGVCLDPQNMCSRAKLLLDMSHRNGRLPAADYGRGTVTVTTAPWSLARRSSALQRLASAPIRPRPRSELPVAPALLS